MGERKIGDMTVRELNQALLDEGFLDKFMIKFSKTVLGLDIEDQKAVNEFRQNLEFLSGAREFLKKMLLSALAALLVVSGWSATYHWLVSFFDKVKTGG